MGSPWLRIANPPRRYHTSGHVDVVLPDLLALIAGDCEERTSLGNRGCGAIYPALGCVQKRNPSLEFGEGEPQCKTLDFSDRKECLATRDTLIMSNSILVALNTGRVSRRFDRER